MNHSSSSGGSEKCLNLDILFSQKADRVCRWVRYGVEEKNGVKDDFQVFGLGKWKDRAGIS